MTRILPVGSQKPDWLSLLLNTKPGQLSAGLRLRIVQDIDIPPYLLGSFWTRLVGGYGFEVSKEQYFSLIESKEEFRFDSEIRRDINRTFPSLKFFKEVQGQQQLFNVLKAYALYNPEVGYCQGMGFIVGMLLSHLNEVDAFNVLVGLMRKDGEYNMQGLYKPGLPLLNEYLKELDAMIETELPALSNHLEMLGIETSMFASQWILTLFVYNLEWSQSRIMFTLFLLYKMNIIVRFSIFFLSQAQGDLLSMGFEGTLGRINSMKNVRMEDFMEWCNKKDHSPKSVRSVDESLNEKSP